MSGPRPCGEVLFLAHRIPWPPDRGDKIRAYHVLRAIAELASVHVGCFADDARDMGFAPAMAAVTASQCVRPHPRGKLRAGLRGLAHSVPFSVALLTDRTMRDYVRRVLRNRPIDAIFGFSGQTAQFVPILPPTIRFVMDLCDVDSAKFAAYGADQSGLMGWVNRREGRLLAAYERAIAERADMTLFVSAAEAALFRQMHDLPDASVRSLENGVALDYFAPDAAFARLSAEVRGAGPLILFTGQMDYAPNIEAVRDFARASLPVVRQQHPEARFAIVGRAPTLAVRALGQLPGVLVAGAVEDVRGWLAAADVVVAPLRIARGVQNKVLEAMAMARPVVASAQAAQGIDAQYGRDLLVADTPADEAALVLDLLANRARADALGQAARAHVATRYGWARQLAPLEALLFGDPVVRP